MIVFAADTALGVYELFMKDAKNGKGLQKTAENCRELQRTAKDCLSGQRKHSMVLWVLLLWQEPLPEWLLVPWIPPGAGPEQQRLLQTLGLRFQTPPAGGGCSCCPGLCRAFAISGGATAAGKELCDTESQDGEKRGTGRAEEWAELAWEPPALENPHTLKITFIWCNTRGAALVLPR